MTGSLTIKNNKYYIIVRIPDENGKLKQKWISTNIPAKGGKRKAEQKLRQILSQFERDSDLSHSDMLFSEWLVKWLDIKKLQVRPITLHGYQSHIKTNISPYFDSRKIKLKSITAQDIQDYYIAKLTDGLSPNSIKHHHIVINGALKEAVRKRHIRFNPAQYITLPKQQPYESKAYTAEQAAQLLSVLDDEPLKPTVILGLYYGLRRSEVCGLRWQDIDFQAGTMQICNTVVRCTKTIEQEQTKSKASKRKMVLIPATVPYLQKLHSRYLSNLQADPIGHVCVDSSGKPFAPDYITKGFQKLLKRHNLPRIRFHELRHTAGSILLDNGMNLKQIQEYLGHGDISTTANIYAHLTIEGKRQSAQVMDKVFSSSYVLDKC